MIGGVAKFANSPLKDVHQGTRKIRQPGPDPNPNEPEDLSHLMDHVESFRSAV